MSHADDLQVPDDVRAMMGVHVQTKTLRNNATSMRMLVKFMIKAIYADNYLTAPDALQCFR